MKRNLHSIAAWLISSAMALTTLLVFNFQIYYVNAESVLKSQYMYRLYNPNSGEHFYSASVDERNQLYLAGWNYEGVGWFAPTNEGAPVYRLFNPNARNAAGNIVGDHHYTMSAEERDNLVSLGWHYEGVAWNSSEAGKGVPLYRMYNPNADSGSHHYTLSDEEKVNLVNAGWNFEGEAWYGTLVQPEGQISNLPERIVPTPSPQTPQPTSPSQVMETYYIGNKKSKVFHRPGCPSVRRMKESSKTEFRNRESAISAGYTPCKDCRP